MKLLKRLQSPDGQALAEFAVVFPVQLLVTLGIIQLALVLVARDVVNYAAHMAARAELVGQEPTVAAAMVCSPITGTSVGARTVRMVPGLGTTAYEQRTAYGSSISFPHWDDPLPSNTGLPGDDMELPGWGRLRKSGVSLLKTHTEVIQPRNGDKDYVEVRVLYEYELPIPAVNWLFSSHRIGGSPHLGIVRTARVPRPWFNDTRGKTPHPVIPDMDEGSP